MTSRGAYSRIAYPKVLLTTLYGIFSAGGEPSWCQMSQNPGTRCSRARLMGLPSHVSVILTTCLVVFLVFYGMNVVVGSQVLTTAASCHSGRLLVFVHHVCGREQLTQCNSDINRTGSST